MLKRWNPEKSSHSTTRYSWRQLGISQRVQIATIVALLSLIGNKIRKDQSLFPSSIAIWEISQNSCPCDQAYNEAVLYSVATKIHQAAFKELTYESADWQVLIFAVVSTSDIFKCSSWRHSSIAFIYFIALATFFIF